VIGQGSPLSIKGGIELSHMRQTEIQTTEIQTPTNSHEAKSRHLKEKSRHPKEKSRHPQSRW
jgi:hypothetical protein